MFRSVIARTTRRLASNGGVPSSPSSGVFGNTPRLYATTTTTAEGGSSGARLALQTMVMGGVAGMVGYEASRSIRERSAKPSQSGGGGSGGGATAAQSTAVLVAEAPAGATAEGGTKPSTSTAPTTSTATTKKSKEKSSTPSPSPPAPPAPAVAKSDADLFYAQLLSQRRIFLNGRVDDRSAHSLVGKMLFLDAVVGGAVQLLTSVDP
jgi:hypothetical protein